jgi:hypothetical protein
MTIVRYVILLVVMSLSAVSAWADDDLAVSDSNPYTPIVTRNVFGLLPIPVKDPSADVPAVAPPKITPNGIITIFGSKEALFKVAGTPKPGQPLHDSSYELGEGESQDDIEVVKIDVPSQTITFNNHGTVQELPLAAAPDLSTPASSAPSVASSGVPVPKPATPFNHRRPAGGPAFDSQPSNAEPQRLNTSNDSNSSLIPPGFMGANVDPNDNSPEATSLAAQILMIEHQRSQLQSQGNSAAAQILPPTVLTPQNQSDEGAAPPTP